MSESPKSKGRPHAPEVVHLEQRMLLSRHCSGDVTAFPELVRLFGTSLYSYIVRSGVHPGARDDVFQEVFIKVHCQAHLYQPERPLEPWLFTITRNTCRSHFRKVRVRQIVGQLPEENTLDGGRSPGEDTITSAPLPSQPSAEAHADSKQTLEWLDRTIAALPPQQREVLNLCCVNGLQHKEAAQILGMPVNTVKTHLNRARISLSKALSRRKADARREVS